MAIIKCQVCGLQKANKLCGECNKNVCKTCFDKTHNMCTRCVQLGKYK